MPPFEAGELVHRRLPAREVARKEAAVANGPARPDVDCIAVMTVFDSCPIDGEHPLGSEPAPAPVAAALSARGITPVERRDR